MSAKKTFSHVTLIGLFVILSLGLLVVLVLSLGGKRFSNAVNYRLYFSSSVRGLANGAPVMFRGVKVGQVTSMRVIPREDRPWNSPDEQKQFQIEVVVALVPEMLGLSEDNVWASALIGKGGNREALRKIVRRLVIEDGMRARLQTLSFLTGQLYVDMTFDVSVDEAERNRSKVAIDAHVIPTQISMLEEISRKLGRKEMTSQIESLYELSMQICDFIQSGKSEKLMNDVSEIAGGLRKSSQCMEKELPMLLAELRRCIAKVEETTAAMGGDVRSAAKKFGTLAQLSGVLVTNVDAMVQENRPDLRQTVMDGKALMAETRQSMAQLEAVLSRLNQVVQPDSPQSEKLAATLNECNEAAVRLRQLLDTLSRNPQSLWLGK